MIIDVTGVELIPGNHGKDCPGNGKHFDAGGKPIECCCDECDYLMCCFFQQDHEQCKICDDASCPRLSDNYCRKQSVS